MSIASTSTIHRTVAGYFWAFLLLGMASAAIGPALPHLARHTGSALSTISLVFVGNRLGYMAGSFLGGRLYDRTRGHTVMVAMLAALALWLALAPLAGSLAVLAPIFLLIGFSEGSVDVGGNVLLVWLAPRRLGPLMNALHLFFGLGAFLAPVVLAQSLRLSGDVVWGFWTLAVLVVPGLLRLLRLESPPRRQEHGPTGQTAAPRAVPLLLTAFLFLYVAAEASFGDWIYTYAVARGLAGQVTAGYLTSAYWGAFTVGRLAAVAAALRVRPVPLLALSLAGSLASLALLLALPGPAAAWTASMLLGLSLATIFPSTVTLASQTFPLTGRITGLFLVGASLGSMALPWLIGQLFDRMGPQTMVVAILADCAAAVLVFSFTVLLIRRRAALR